MSSAVTVAHNFEAAHRLPHLDGKCRSLHGHSWWVEVTVAAPAPDAAGLVVEFGAYKAALRTWIDRNLDHGTLLAGSDRLYPAIAGDGCKVFLFGRGYAAGLTWPTVENVATLLSRVAVGCLEQTRRPDVDAAVTRVRVAETHVNTAEWTAT